MIAAIITTAVTINPAGDKSHDTTIGSMSVMFFIYYTADIVHNQYGQILYIKSAL